MDTLGDKPAGAQPVATAATANPPASASAAATPAAMSVILALSLCHFLNDTMQSMLSAIYPMLKDNYALTFGQIGLLTFTFQFTASLLQPLIGAYTDKRPIGYALPVGMGFSIARPDAACGGRSLLAAARRGLAGGSGLRRVPSRILAHSPGWPRAESMARRSRSFSLAAISAPPPDRCWRPSSWFPEGRAALHGSASQRCAAW